MIEQDTIKLLRECDAGIKMGIASIDDVADHVKNGELHRKLADCRAEHAQLQTEIRKLLEQYKDDGKNPNPIAKGMSWMKTNMKMGWDESDATVADLLTDGCDMGMKSLYRYLNQYKDADQESIAIAKRLIDIEAKLEAELRKYL